MRPGQESGPGGRQNGMSSSKGTSSKAPAAGAGAEARDGPVSRRWAGAGREPRS
jgi:hypothetical protein